MPKERMKEQDNTKKLKVRTIGRKMSSTDIFIVNSGSRKFSKCPEMYFEGYGCYRNSKNQRVYGYSRKNNAWMVRVPTFESDALPQDLKFVYLTTDELYYPEEVKDFVPKHKNDFPTQYTYVKLRCKVERALS